jgi:peptidoglycan/LPS O-acetylase OafA/YrhL
MAYLTLCLCFGLAGGVVGRIKGSSFIIWFIVSAVLPVIGLLAAVLYRVERDEVRRACPRCGRVLKLYDQVCFGCGLDLDFPDRGIVPESQAAASHGRR